MTDRTALIPGRCTSIAAGETGNPGRRSGRGEIRWRHGLPGLQNAFRDHRTDSLRYYLFDLLFLNGTDLSHVPLEQRKDLLAELLARKEDSSPILISEHVEGNGPAFFKQACQSKLEGIISSEDNATIRVAVSTG